MYVAHSVPSSENMSLGIECDSLREVRVGIVVVEVGGWCWLAVPHDACWNRFEKSRALEDV